MVADTRRHFRYFSFEDSEIEFCLNKFLPEISNATANMVLDQTEIQLVQNTTVVIVVKFLYAALWQVSVNFRKCIFAFLVTSDPSFWQTQDKFFKRSPGIGHMKSLAPEMTNDLV